MTVKLSRLVVEYVLVATGLTTYDQRSPPVFALRAPADQAWLSEPEGYMADANPHDHTPTAPSADAAAMASTIDVGARHPQGWPHHLLAGVALVWSLFQLYYASKSRSS